MVFEASGLEVLPTYKVCLIIVTDAFEFQLKLLAYVAV